MFDGNLIGIILITLLIFFAGKNPVKNLLLVNYNAKAVLVIERTEQLAFWPLSMTEAFTS